MRRLSLSSPNHRHCHGASFLWCSLRVDQLHDPLPLEPSVNPKGVECSFHFLDLLVQVPQLLICVHGSLQLVNRLLGIFLDGLEFVSVHVKDGGAPLAFGGLDEAGGRDVWVEDGRRARGRIWCRDKVGFVGVVEEAVERDGGSSVRDAVMDLEFTAGESAPWLVAVADLPAVFLGRVEDDRSDWLVVRIGASRQGVDTHVGGTAGVWYWMSWMKVQC